MTVFSQVQHANASAKLYFVLGF